MGAAGCEAIITQFLSTELGASTHNAGWSPKSAKRKQSEEGVGKMWRFIRGTLTTEWDVNYYKHEEIWL